MTQKVYKLINAAISTGGATGRLKISELDTSADFLDAKLTTDSTITKTIINPGNIENIRLGVDATQLDHQALIGAGTLTHQQIEDELTNLDDKTNKFTVNFNATTDWTLNVDQYELQVLAATHEKGVTPLFYIVDDLGDSVELASNVDVNGNITISVISDLRFAGKLIIL